MASRKYFESKYCDSTLYKYVWDAAKIIHKRKFIFLNAYLTKEKRLKNYHLGFQWKMMEKWIKPNINWKK